MLTLTKKYGINIKMMIYKLQIQKAACADVASKSQNNASLNFACLLHHMYLCDLSLPHF